MADNDSRSATYFVQWPSFKFLDFLFENEVLGYNGGVMITIVNNWSTMNAMELRFGCIEHKRTCKNFC